MLTLFADRIMSYLNNEISDIKENCSRGTYPLNLVPQARAKKEALEQVGSEVLKILKDLEESEEDTDDDSR